ncbi:IS5 family transposase [Spirosoma utsteinense]|uniref:Transposase n=4 Tax=Spirosoma utsteinense TaxID=2585773 RepID=A0ABR6WGZ5_9BACT|nr:IS5 family transposase [Spirosoma utsteinense]MBC3789512.1 transposase [Spirosoma utsteinense]MBC3795415.1 transposase [Spirosoma utsteinense]
MNESFQALTDSQWQVIQQILDDKRQRWHSLRDIINAILWLNYTGVQWRELPKMTGEKLPWQTVYYHFRQFKLRGVWEQVLDSLVVKERKRQHREETPSLLAIDSQSVKIMQFIEEETGLDANKKINGRKRSIAVDRLGLPWSLAVTGANVSDNEAGRLVVDRLRGKVPRLEVIAADHGYKVSFIEHVESNGWQVEIAQKPESSRGFVPQKNRWPVERSFGWLNFRRRLFRDVDKTIESSEAMLRIGFISILLNRLAK